MDRSDIVRRNIPPEPPHRTAKKNDLKDRSFVFPLAGGNGVVKNWRHWNRLTSRCRGVELWHGEV
jgi:hypothetical protein